MKRYLLFEWVDCEECGGMNDFTDSYDTIDEAIEAHKMYNYQIVDREHLKL